MNKLSHPLTSSQREIWFDQLLHEEIPLYNIGGYVKIPGVVDVKIFEQALNLLIEKHDTLRTVLLKERDEDGIPLQTYAESLPIQLIVKDVSQAANPESAALHWMQQRFIEPFELIEKPLFRYDLVKVKEDCYYWLLQYHHLITDGYGVALLNRSLAEIYTQLMNGQQPDLASYSYTQFIETDRAYVESEQFEKQRQYWLEKYSTVPEPLLTPRYRSNYTESLIGSGCEELYLPREFYNRLGILAKQHNATLFHVLLGALYVYFTRIAQRDDFTIGLPVLNRANAQFKQTAGLFTGVSPTWFNYGKELSFAELLQQISKTLKANYRHQRFPVSEINRAVGLGISRSQLFDVNLSFENHDYDAQFEQIEGYFTALLHAWEQTPLMIFVRDFHSQSDVKFDFVFNQAYFNSQDINALQARFVTILEAILRDSLISIRQLPIMTELEIKQLQTWNDTVTDYPRDKTIVDLFEQQVAQTPDNIAVVFESQQLTYQQLNEKANQVAHHLLQLEIKEYNPLIAIMVERSLEMVIGLLGILKTGAAYVPIDPSYPSERIEYLLQDSHASLLLTQSHLTIPITQHCVFLDKTDFSEQSTHDPKVNCQPTDLAYVIYTSGSTGKPKGVMIEQYSLLNSIQARRNYYQDSEIRFLLLTSFAFDSSVACIFGSLSTGGQLHISRYTNDLSELLDLIQRYNISHLLCVPTLYSALLQYSSTNSLQSLDTIGLTH